MKKTGHGISLIHPDANNLPGFWIQRPAASNSAWYQPFEFKALTPTPRNQASWATSSLKSWVSKGCLHRQWVADFPMVTKWIGYSSQSPSMGLLNRILDGRTSRNRLGEQDVGIWDGQYHPDRRVGRCDREDLGCGGTAADPKFSAGNRQSRHTATAGVIHPKDLLRAEGISIEFHRYRAHRNGEPGSNRRDHHLRDVF